MGGNKGHSEHPHKGTLIREQVYVQCVYIVCVDRERERERERVYVYMNVCIVLYMCICICNQLYTP